MLDIVREKISSAEVGFPSPSTISPSRIKILLRRTARVLVPSFLSSNASQYVRNDIRPTDFLDGMRGYAAYIVVVTHYCQKVYLNMEKGYVSSDGVGDHWVFQLPFIRIVVSGPYCVYLFFVISGFSISLKPLGHVRRGSYSALVDNLASTTFRRAWRLYLPCLGVLLFTMLLTYFRMGDFYFTGHTFPEELGIPPAFDSFLEQTWHLIREISRWGNPFGLKRYYIRYAMQLWTIPVELRGSLASLLAILGLAKVRSNVRIGTIAALVIYFQLQIRPEVSLFLGGTLLAELYLIRQDRVSLTTKSEIETEGQRLCNIAIFMTGLFFGSYPPKGDEVWFWSLYNSAAYNTVGTKDLAPFHVATSIGAMLLVLAVSRSPTLQGLFTTRLAKYMGDISFSLYLVHIAVLFWIGYANIRFFWSITGNDTVLNFVLGHAMAVIVQTVILIWIADVHWRLVDAPVVGLTRRLEEMCTIGT